MLPRKSVDEAFARPLENWDRVSRMASPSGWTYTVALHHARRTARRLSMERHLHFRHPLLSQLSTRQRVNAKL
jgi:predicted RNA polymerase sigma factor